MPSRSRSEGWKHEGMEGWRGGWDDVPLSWRGCHNGYVAGDECPLEMMEYEMEGRMDELGVEFGGLDGPRSLRGSMKESKRGELKKSKSSGSEGCRRMAVESPGRGCRPESPSGWQRGWSFGVGVEENEGGQKKEVERNPRVEVVGSAMVGSSMVGLRGKGCRWLKISGGVWTPTPWGRWMMGRSRQNPHPAPPLLTAGEILDEGESWDEMLANLEGKLDCWNLWIGVP